MSITGQIRQTLEQIPEGEPFTSTQLLGLGTRAAIDQSLSRLAKAGVLSRLSRGVYVRPKHSRFVGITPPDPYQIAEAIAKASGEVVQVHGAEAARRLGLSTQAPTQAIFYTTGPSRRLRLGMLNIVLKHVSPRKILMSNRPAGLALTALWYLGKELVTPEIIGKIRQKLPTAEYQALIAAAPSMPSWMSDVLHEYSRGAQHG